MEYVQIVLCLTEMLLCRWLCLVVMNDSKYYNTHGPQLRKKTMQMLTSSNTDQDSVKTKLCKVA